MKRLAILGASGHGKVVADIAETCGWETIEFFDDASEAKGSVNGSWSVIGSIQDFITCSSSYDGVIVAIGNNQIRSEIYDTLLEKNINLITLVHPTAVVSRYARIGLGSVVVAGSVINAYAIIGCGVIINTGATVDHDCLLEDYVHISPGAHLAGGVVIGKKSWIGIGSSIKQKVVVGAQVTVGAGATVVKNIPDNSTVVGIPARPFHKSNFLC